MNNRDKARSIMDHKAFNIARWAFAIFGAFMLLFMLYGQVWGGIMSDRNPDFYVKRDDWAYRCHFYGYTPTDKPVLDIRSDRSVAVPTPNPRPRFTQDEIGSFCVGACPAGDGACRDVCGKLLGER